MDHRGKGREYASLLDFQQSEKSDIAEICCKEEGHMKTSLRAVEKKRAYEDIVQQVLTLIENGKLKRGDQLPSERELTETFKVSRTTVREAIRTLESMKLLQCRQGNGTYVLASSEEALIQPLAAALFNAKDDIRDIFYIRKIIEPHVAHLAAENATPQEIEEMEKILHEQEACIGRGESVIETDSALPQSSGQGDEKPGHGASAARPDRSFEAVAGRISHGGRT